MSKRHQVPGEPEQYSVPCEGEDCVICTMREALVELTELAPATAQWFMEIAAREAENPDGYR